MMQLVDVSKRSYPRKVRVEPLILRSLEEVLVQRVNDPRLKSALLLRVEMARDLSHATVFFTLAHEEVEAKSLEKLLNNKKTLGFFRSILAQEVILRQVPQLSFRFDKAYQKTQDLLALLAQVSENIESPEKID